MDNEHAALVETTRRLEVRQIDLAAALLVSQATVSRYLAGRQAPPALVRRVWREHLDQLKKRQQGTA